MTPARALTGTEIVAVLKTAGEPVSVDALAKLLNVAARPDIGITQNELQQVRSHLNHLERKNRVIRHVQSSGRVRVLWGAV